MDSPGGASGLRSIQRALREAESVEQVLAPLAEAAALLRAGQLGAQLARFSGLLLSEVLVQWVPAIATDQRRDCFDVFFCEVPLAAALPPILARLVTLAGPARPEPVALHTAALAQLIIRAVAAPGRVGQAVVAAASRHELGWDDLVQQLGSVPDRVANAAGAHTNVPVQLRPPEWFGHLAGEFAGALVPPTDAALHRAAVGLAKVAGSGHADAALHAVSALPPDLCPKLASALPPAALRLLVRRALCRPDLEPGWLARWIQPPLVPLLQLPRLLSSELLPRRSLRSLAATLSDQNRLGPVLLSCCQLFADPSAISGLSPGLLRQLARWICVSLPRIGALPPDSPMLAALVAGIPTQLSSPIKEYRHCAMRVAVAMSLQLSPEEPLRFDDLSSSSEDEPPPAPPPDPEPEAPAPEAPAPAVQNVWGAAWADESDESDDDGPFEAVCKPPSTDGQPKSLVEVIGLLRQEKAEPLEAGLCAVPRLVGRELADTSAVCEELCLAVLHVSNSCDLEGFDHKRKAALVALCKQIPAAAARVLAGQFYTQNVSLETRLLVLDVISGAAAEIAGLGPAGQAGAPPPLTPLGVSNDGKTRRWTLASHTREHQPSSSRNQFGEVAGEFFYPLMVEYDNRIGTLDLLSKDAVLPLGQLLCTLGTVLEAANNTVAHPRMAGSLVEFLIAIRLYADEYVERCGMFALSRVLLTWPASVRLEGLLFDYLGELQLWVQAIAGREGSPINQQCAGTCLKLFGRLPEMSGLSLDALMTY